MRENASRDASRKNHVAGFVQEHMVTAVFLGKLTSFAGTEVSGKKKSPKEREREIEKGRGRE